jgi:hypothetical protein
MKKVIILLLAIFIGINSIYSSVLGATLDLYEDIRHTQKEIETNTIPSRKEMKLQIAGLDDTTDLDQFYKENKLPILWPALKNLILGFGTGTKDQGKIVTSSIYAAIDTTVIVSGLTIAIFAFFNDSFWAGVSSSSPDPLTPQVLMYTALVEIGIHSIEFLDAIIYGSSYNLMMKNKLKLVASIEPVEKEITIGTKIILS